MPTKYVQVQVSEEKYFKYLQAAAILNKKPSEFYEYALDVTAEDTIKKGGDTLNKESGEE